MCGVERQRWRLRLGRMAAACVAPDVVSYNSAAGPVLGFAPRRLIASDLIRCPVSADVFDVNFVTSILPKLK
eukprot:1054018-Lingulodinium_polyedra.AAC.1